MAAEPRIIAFDLGTGGCKASLYDARGRCLADAVRGYPTRHPASGRDEQRPEDWWTAIVAATGELLARSGAAPAAIAALAISGQSLSLLPLDGDGELLSEWCPIWSDSRAGAQAAAVFDAVGEQRWYETTGNGFPPPLYTAFKLMWLREHEPATFARTRLVLGSKDWINLRLCGRAATDPSYASGSGVWNLEAGDYDAELLAASGVARELLPDVVPASEVLGGLLPAAAQALGLVAGTPVVAGGVDNSCMAIGAGTTEPGDLYASLGSSSWLTVAAERPVLDAVNRPFTFASLAPGLFHSAMSTFGAGTSLAWVRDLIDPGLASAEGGDATLIAMAADSPPGARGLLFLPALGGGTVLEGGPDVRGGWVGLDLSHTRADLVRAALEGIAFALRRAHLALRAMAPTADAVRAVGGGSLSPLWRQIYADVWDVELLKTSVDRNAATLGAAAAAAVGVGLWSSYAPVRDAHDLVERHVPAPEAVAVYRELAPLVDRAAAMQAELGAALAPFRAA
jgi:xylulokinase